MADVTNELIYEVVKGVQSGLGGLETGRRDIKEELIAARLHQNASQGELNASLSRMGGLESRLDRIEKRLDIIGEPAE